MKANEILQLLFYQQFHISSNPILYCIENVFRKHYLVNSLKYKLCVNLFLIIDVGNSEFHEDPLENGELVPRLGVICKNIIKHVRITLNPRILITLRIDNIKTSES